MKKNQLTLTAKPLERLAQCKIMAILNITPDSVSGDGVMRDESLIRARIEDHMTQGADIIDIGAESSRPQALPVSLSEEINRLKPVFRVLNDYAIPFSIDTYKPEVMEAALEYGITYINDIKALQTPGALEIAAQSEAQVILMHMQGTPENMQNQPEYTDVTSDVTKFLRKRITACLNAGISSKRIIVDPGFGFGKTIEHNFSLLNNIMEIKSLGYPVLTGISRKSMLNACIELPAHERDYLSAGADIISLLNGASIIRTHQPKLLFHMRKVWLETREH